MEQVSQTASQLNDEPENASMQTLLIVGHAVYLPAAAMAVCSLLDCPRTSENVILQTNTQEAEGYLINKLEGTATNLVR